MPCFDGEEFQNIYAADGAPAYTEQYKQKVVEMVHMNNTHRCATAINGCKKDANDLCKHGYSCSEMISETYVNQVTNRIVYLHRMECNFKIVPYNLQMIMDWDSHINVEYNGSAYCSLYLYKYCYNGAARKERIDLGSEQEHDSLDEIKLFIYRRIMCSMVAVWRMYGYQDYPAPELPVCAFKVCSKAQLKDFIQQCKVTNLQIYYNHPAELDALKYTDFLTKYNMLAKLPKYYEDCSNTSNNISID
jgi:hypothetical protein